MEIKDVLQNEGIILFAQTGSYAYGTNVESSDLDYKGIFVPTLESYFGLKEQKEYNNADGKTGKNKQGDIDLNLIPIAEFVSRAMKGSPSDLELLFIEEGAYEVLTEYGKMLVDNRHLFLSKSIKHRFSGYSFQKLKDMEKSKKEDGSYNTKDFMHSVRLLTSLIEILETCDFTTKRPNSDFLLDCRNGEFTFEEAIQIVKSLDRDVEKAYSLSVLPERVDMEKANKLLINIVKAVRL